MSIIQIVEQACLTDKSAKTKCASLLRLYCNTLRGLLLAEVVNRLGQTALKLKESTIVAKIEG